MIIIYVYDENGKIDEAFSPSLSHLSSSDPLLQVDLKRYDIGKGREEDNDKGDEAGRRYEK